MCSTTRQQLEWEISLTEVQTTIMYATKFFMHIATQMKRLLVIQQETWYLDAILAFICNNILEMYVYKTQHHFTSRCWRIKYSNSWPQLIAEDSHLASPVKWDWLKWWLEYRFLFLLELFCLHINHLNITPFKGFVNW